MSLQLRYESQQIIWPEGRVEHIARHHITPEEVEAVCFGQAFVQRAKSEGDNPIYYALGQTDAGRYLFCVIIQFPDRNGYPVTARPMTDNEKRRFQ
ncbi:MAG: BrnT family toxin, partial [Anaerolineae bacterium]|nr:BrnT family toxin [Anaerolineae bacterium]